MKPGLGLYRSMLTRDNFRFARQAGATHIVAHLTDYFSTPDSLATATAGEAWGVTRRHGQLWSEDELRDLRAAINAEGLELAAIENFDPAFWHDILLDGPQKRQQIEDIKTILRNLGRAGIAVMGYYFSLAGAWGRVPTYGARGGAPAVGYLERDAPEQTPIPLGTAWNMVYDPDAPTGVLDPVSEEEVWQRLEDFLREVVPVAEEAGVRLAAHPDDPPISPLRGTGRLLTHPSRFDRLLAIVPSRANALELCLGTVAEMPGADVYETAEKYSRAGQIGYIHFRNVRGKVPNYEEVFLDEGDVDMIRVLRILHDTGYVGVLIPDHTPQMTCEAPWHAGMAWALGYMTAAIRLVREG